MADMLQVYRPNDNSLIKEIPQASEIQVEQAVSDAHALFQDRSRWLPKHERLSILSKIAEIMSQRKEELARISAEEGGKPWVDTLVEIDRAIEGVRLAGHELRHLKGGEVPMGNTAGSANRHAITLREPIGPVISISAFNHPMNLTIHQTIPAIAVGCPVIIKPANLTPLSALALVEIFYEAGLPKEWCQVLVCNRTLGEKMVSDPRFGYFSFIGSAQVGWYLRSKLAPGVHCALEHGGAAPVVLDETVDLEEILPPLVKGGFYHAGQVCVSVQRVYAPQSIASNLANEMAKQANQLVVGSSLDPKTEVGPLISPKEVERIESWVREAESKGGTILCGGTVLSETMYAPTVILDPPEDVSVSAQEIFGPVVCVYSYEDREEAIQRANQLPFCFQAAVFTKNIDVAWDSVRKLKGTAVMVNDHTAFRVDWMPFGGREHSGMGVGGIGYTMEEMAPSKLVVFKSPSL
jgi:acyl-CoA reductase-like NAD-dependent aldehyde dehydrogenase